MHSILFPLFSTGGPGWRCVLFCVVANSWLLKAGWMIDVSHVHDVNTSQEKGTESSSVSKLWNWRVLLICLVFLFWCFSYSVHSFCDISNICFTFDGLWNMWTSARSLRESLRALICQQLWILLWVKSYRRARTHARTGTRYCYTLPVPSSSHTFLHTQECSHTRSDTHIHTTLNSVNPHGTRRKTAAPLGSSGVLHRPIMITSEALVSSEQNQTRHLEHTHTQTHMHAHTANIPPPASLTLADTSKGCVQGGKSGRVWGIIGDKGSD